MRSGSGGRTLLFAAAKYNPTSFLRSGVLEGLKAADPDLRFVVASPMGRDPRFLAEFVDARTTVEYAPLYRLNAIQLRLNALSIERFARLHPTKAVQFDLERHRLLRKRRLRGLVDGVKSAWSRLPISPRAILDVSDRLVPSATYAPILRRHQPDLVVVPTGMFPAEIPWFIGAHRRGIPCVATDFLWDAFEGKAMMIRGADELLVWSEHARQLAIRRFGYPAASVHVTGAPQFDRYFHRRDLKSRDEFMSGLGFAPNAKLITVGAVPPNRSPRDPERVDMLYAAIRRGEFGPSCALLIRLHPWERTQSRDRWERFRGIPGLRVESAFGEGPDGGIYESGLSYRDLRHLAETLVHTDVLVNVDSTIAFEAVLVDTPVVITAFDGNEVGVPYIESDVQFLDRDNMRGLLDTGAARVVRSPADMIEQVRAYLGDATRDRGARIAAADALYGLRDGGAASRVVTHLLRMTAHGRRHQHSRGRATVRVSA